MGGLIRAFRLRAGLSQSDLAERATVSLAAVAALEQGQRRYPHPRTMRQIAEALDLDAAERERLLLVARRPRRVVGESMDVAPPATADAGFVLRLPETPTPLIGREDEVRAAVTLLLASTPVRLVTLVGTGGVGKTRLVLAIADAVRSVFPDGIWFVDLAPLRDVELIAVTIARSLGLQEAGALGARDLLLTHLHPRSLLIVLDNFEHLLGGAALVADLLVRCPGLVILVTSRAALRLRAERLLPVEPLAAPTVGVSLTVAELAACPSVRLFVDRAQAVAPAFELTEHNAAAVASICRRLDGVPLAIELAATRMGLLDPDSLLGLLEHRLVRLGGGPADLPDRQRTLRATLDWSHALLGPADQLVFRRLGVFAGGWTLEAAQAVCADGALPAADLVDRLEELRRHSLIGVTGSPDGELRFSMLETVREYAAGLLGASGELESVQARHRDWYLTLSERVSGLWYDGAVINRLARDQDNWRIALRWSVRQGDGSAGVRLAIGYWGVWYRFGIYQEGRAWFRTLRTLPGADAVRRRHATAMMLAGHLAYCTGDTAEALELLEAGLALAQTVGDELCTLRCLMILGHVHRVRGDLAEAERHYLAALDLKAMHHGARQIVLAGLARARYEHDDVIGAAEATQAVLALASTGDRPSHQTRPRALEARLEALKGNYLAAWRGFEESLAIFETGRDTQGQVYLFQLAVDTALDQGDWPRAAHDLVRLIRIAGETGEWPALPPALESVAMLLAPREPERALGLVGAADTLRTSLQLVASPRERSRVERWATAAREVLGDAAATAALDRGRTVALVDVLAEARAVCLVLADQPGAPAFTRQDHAPPGDVPAEISG